MACSRVSRVSGRCGRALSACSKDPTASRWPTAPWPSLPPAGRMPGPCPTPRPAGHGAPAVPPARPPAPRRAPPGPRRSGHAAPPPLQQEAAVGHLVGEGMLEGVGVLGEEPRLIEELGRLQVGQAAVHRLGHLGNGLQQGQGHLGANHRGRLQEAASPRVAAGRYAPPAPPAPWLAPGWSAAACARR